MTTTAPVIAGDYLAVEPGEIVNVHCDTDLSTRWGSYKATVLNPRHMGPWGECVLVAPFEGTGQGARVGITARRLTHVGPDQPPHVLPAGIASIETAVLV